MNRIFIFDRWATIATFAGVILSGCSKSPNSSNGPAAQQAQVASTLFVAGAPKGPVDVAAAKKSADRGKSIVVRGRIGGSTEPFVADRACFTLVDLSLPPCNVDSKMHCDTPWDYCCEPPDKLAASSVTIRVVDAKGESLSGTLNGVHGLKPLAEVTVAGRVAEKTTNNVVIDATAFYVKPG